MADIVSLNDSNWQCKPYIGLDWQWRKAHLFADADPLGWLPATIPGCAQNDLWQAGVIPDPYFERNSLLIEWIPQRTWLYRRVFVVGEEYRGQRIRLRFEGIDYAGQVYLNGSLLGVHEGMAIPALFEIGEVLRYGEENLLVVVIVPAPDEQPQIGRTSLVRTHKARMPYWWDFCPRMVPVGLWDRVTLESTGPLRIDDVWVQSQLSSALDHARLEVRVAVDAARATSAAVEVRVRYAGDLVAEGRIEQRVRDGIATVQLELTLEAPTLWWPNGYGEPALYEMEVTLADVYSAPDGVSDARQVAFGFRRVELVPNETLDASARSYTLVVNGQRMFIRGWNWVPMDVLYGVERPEKLRRLLTLAQRAHVNLLRVWGGAPAEKEAFYELCDRLGILVWQEFPQSSSGVDNWPATDDAFVQSLRAAAESIVTRRRNHPSLAIWCGGNELMDDAWRPLDERHPVLGALRDTVARLDPDRCWLPTSASGPESGNSLEVIHRNPLGMHDVHGPWEHQGLEAQYSLYNQGQSLLHSEFGVEAITNERTLDALIAPEHQWPISLTNPYWEHLGSWWVKEARWLEVYGTLDGVGTAIRATQAMQADGLRYAVEADRRRKYHNSGTLPWQFSEPYPMAACTSVVDYYATPKPAYYAVAQAYELVHVSARFARQAWGGEELFSAEGWISSGRPTPLKARVVMQVVGAGGHVYRSVQLPVTAASDAATLVATLDLELATLDEDVFLLDLRLEGLDNALISHARYVFTRTANLAPLLALPHTSLAIELTPEGVALTNVGDTMAYNVWLEDAREARAAGSVDFGTNAFVLLPGEQRCVRIGWEDVPESERLVTVSAWNVISTTFPMWSDSP